MKNRELAAELERIRQKAGGMLLPADVVEEARSEGSILHSRFDWDDTHAAEQYRLWQARELIRTVHVKMVSPKGAGQITEIYVSLRADRKEGGYRHIVEVMSDATLRKKLIQEALKDLEVWQHKYEQLKELEPIFKARKKVEMEIV